MNTLGSYAVFLILATWLPEPVAYTIGFAAGLVFTTVASSSWVFRTGSNRSRQLRFAAWYLLVWLIGLGIVAVIGRGGLERHLVTSAVLLVVTVPLNFVVGRRILAGAPGGRAEVR